MKTQIQIQKQEITVQTTNQQQDAQVTTTTVPNIQVDPSVTAK